jgi:hypothetical protein
MMARAERFEAETGKKLMLFPKGITEKFNPL